MKAMFAVDRSMWLRLKSRIAYATGKTDDAEDILSTAYVKFAEKKEGAVENEEAFLFRIAINLHIDERRKASSRGGFAHLEANELIVDPTPLQDEILDSRRQWEAVQSIIDRLPERTREILFMRRVDGMRYKEIARELGITESAVEKHIAKAATLLLRASRNR